MRRRFVPVVTTLALALGALVGLTLTTAAPASAAAQVFPVPSPGAGLARITTAPNGDMWFVEKGVNKIGRITPAGQISEFATRFSGSASQTMDLDIAPDGRIWVTNDSGREISVYSPAGQLLSYGSLGDYPYGGAVRVDPAGTVWITMNYDESFVARVVGGQSITASATAPECDDYLGEAADGSMWCGKQGSLVHLNADGSGAAGVAPVGVYASWVRAIAAGPVGDIWFATHQSGSYAFSPSEGYVGYLAGANPVRFDVGDRVAPNDLVRGPDNAMWFTSVGAAKGIGHVDANGRGAITQVGGYEPESLTFVTDGAVWFTDETNNAIVRVPTSELQATNVDPGAGSVFAVGQAVAPSVPVKLKGKQARVRAGRVPLTLTCPKGTKGGCKGKVTLVTAKPVRKPGAGRKTPAKVQKLTGTTKFTLKAGKRGVVRPKLTKTGARLAGGKGIKAVVVVGGVPIGTVKVRR